MEQHDSSRAQRLKQREQILLEYDRGPHTKTRMREAQRLLALLDAAIPLEPLTKPTPAPHPRELERILGLHQRHYSPSSISRLVGCSTETVRQAVRAAHAPR